MEGLGPPNSSTGRLVMKRPDCALSVRRRLTHADLGRGRRPPPRRVLYRPSGTVFRALEGGPWARALWAARAKGCCRDAPSNAWADRSHVHRSGIAKRVGHKSRKPSPCPANVHRRRFGRSHIELPRGRDEYRRPVSRSTWRIDGRRRGLELERCAFDRPRPSGPIPKVSISVKPTALHPYFDPIDPESSIERLFERLLPIARSAKAQGAHLHIDVEEYQLKELTHQSLRDFRLA